MLIPYLRLTKLYPLSAETEWYMVYANAGNVNNLQQLLKAIVGAFPGDNMSGVDMAYPPNQAGYWAPVRKIAENYRIALSNWK